MAKRFIVKIDPKGHINVSTDGIKGRECLDYISVLESLLDAKAVDSEFTPEYYEQAVISETADVAQKHRRINRSGG